MYKVHAKLFGNREKVKDIGKVMKKFLKVVIVIAIIIALMHLFNISVFVGKQRIDRFYFVDLIRNFNLERIFNEILRFFDRISFSIQKLIKNISTR